MADAFASLPEREQSILILHCVLELADGEIGSLVGMSRSAVQRHRTKALNELQKRLEDRQGSETEHEAANFLWAGVLLSIDCDRGGPRR